MVNKITTPPTQNEVIDKINELVDGKQDTITSSNKLSASLVSGLATVATSGSYNDLSGTPTIPTVNNATLTITQGGTTKGTFTANASSDVTIALDAGGGGGSYTAGTGIVIENDEISVDGVEPNLVDAEIAEEADVEETSEITLAQLLTTITGYDITKTQTLKNVQGTFTWVDD